MLCFSEAKLDLGKKPVISSFAIVLVFSLALVNIFYQGKQLAIRHVFHQNSSWKNMNSVFVFVFKQEKLFFPQQQLGAGKEEKVALSLSMLPRERSVTLLCVVKASDILLITLIYYVHVFISDIQFL
jgi:hypothetical protein